MSNEYNLIKYWRNSLADAARMNIDAKKLEAAFTIPQNDVQAGFIDACITDKLFSEAFRIKKEDCNGEDATKDFVNVLICPIKAMAKVEHGSENDTFEQIITPLWIPAVISKSGRLLPKTDSFPWIPRDLLEPSFGKTITVGCVADVDEYLTIHKQLFKQENGWSAVWEYSKSMFEHVIKSPFDEYTIENYEIDSHAYIVVESPVQGATKNIISLYDNIIRDNQVPLLLKRYANIVDEQLFPLLDYAGEMEICKKHLGQMNYNFSLSVSQRQSMHHTLTIGAGQMLAVNGPPGTGKTTLLQSVVASLWVDAALQETEPPVIVAASANNQAVTNIIDSFGKIDEPEASLLAGRWLNGINSYGLYCPSQENIKKTKTKFQVADCSAKNRGPFPEKVEDSKYVKDNLEYFISNCSKYAQKELSNLSVCLKFLHDDLKDTVLKIEEGIHLFTKYTEYKEKISSFYAGYGGIETYLEQKKLEIKNLNSKIDDIKVIENGWLQHFDTQHWLLSLLSFLPPVKNRIMLRNRRYHNSTDFKIVADFSSQVDILNFIDDKKNKLFVQKKDYEDHLKNVESDNSELKNLKNSFWSWINKNEMEWEKKENNIDNGIKKEIEDLYSLLRYIDMNLRYKAFKIATHYWECRWLIQMMEQINNDYKETVNKENLKRKWYRYAKLTPCIVSTFYMIPKFFTAWRGNEQPLYDFIDLLIIDEAGQVPAEIAGAVFSLAKKSIVVGDALQIEPVWSINERIDIGNLKRHQIISSDSDSEIDTFLKSGMAASCGSVMKIAQRASKYQKYTAERGMFLSEHRRCFSDIIAYCNELAYKGRLEPQRENESGMPLPHMGYRDIKGKAAQFGGSWGNKKEAEAIAMWIRDNRDKLEQFYSEKDKKKRKQDIKTIIGVVTPFSYQGRLIRSELKQLEIKDITVGTVHSLQGAERNVIIFSSVYDSSQNGRNFFFDNGPNMLNVAVSRAKDSFLVFGDINIFDAGSNKPSGILRRNVKIPVL
ncbi:DEAD/DEAH box helicase [Lacrimispora sphenoides]|uniref:Superfamily I DNA and/or RNA helicase n=1 Tax=Lacrimispora sphenoides JCM 1415 TaxID=1297793 RepID=A0ABY1CAQ8_9FIRM|nr:AAA domain-containing protein [Lacrimispora sphenoides]SET85795.1 Superfamily I DNA and/or RNA helicase [[Clostridium] sphenoides JCM 1415]SUY51825.1 putative DNA helicase [Lacrimispora sphenoides]